jgi:hypothetical protein
MGVDFMAGRGQQHHPKAPSSPIMGDSLFQKDSKLFSFDALLIFETL